MSIKIAAIGLTHSHIYGQVDCLLREGATLAGFWSDEEDAVSYTHLTLPTSDLV